MKLLQKLARAVWNCKYHIAWCPKYRFRILKGEVAKSVVEIIQQLCEWKRDVKGLREKGWFATSNYLTSLLMVVKNPNSNGDIPNSLRGPAVALQHHLF